MPGDTRDLPPEQYMPRQWNARTSLVYDTLDGQPLPTTPPTPNDPPTRRPEKRTFIGVTWDNPASLEWYKGDAPGKRGIELEGYPASEAQLWSGNWGAEYGTTWMSNLPDAYRDDLTSDRTFEGGVPKFGVGTATGTALELNVYYWAQYQTDIGEVDHGMVHLRASAVRRAGTDEPQNWGYCHLNKDDNSCLFYEDADDVINYVDGRRGEYPVGGAGSWQQYAYAPEVVSGSMDVGGAAKAVNLSTSHQNADIGFNGEQGQRVSLTASAISFAGGGPGCQVRFAVYSPNGSLLVPWTSACSSIWFSDVMKLPVTGRYRILVDPKDAATGSVSLTLREVAPDVSGQLLRGGDPIGVPIDEPGQNAVLTIDAEAGDHVSLKATNLTFAGGGPGCQVRFTIFNPDGSVLLPRSLSCTSWWFSDKVSLPVSGRYRVLVDPLDMATGAGALTLYGVPADTSATVSPNGSVTSLSAGTPGQNAQLLFDGQQGQRVSVKATNLTFAGGGPGCQVRFTIYNPDGSVLSPRSLSCSSWWFSDVVTLPVSGRYRVLVDPLEMATGTGALTVYDVPTDASASVSPNGSATSVAIGTPGQNAQLAFDGRQGQRVSVRATNLTFAGGGSGCQVRFTIFNPDGSVLVPRSLSCSSWWFSDALTLPVSGHYRVVVDPVEMATGGGALTVYDVPEDVAASVSPNGSATPVAIRTPGQNAQVAFDGQQGQRVTLKATNLAFSGGGSGCQVRFIIFNPDGSVLLPRALACSSPWTGDVVTLPAGGRYRIVVDPVEGATGSVSLALTAS